MQRNQSTVAQMHAKINDAKKVLADGYEFYREALKESAHLTPYQRGNLRERVWEIEHMFGRKWVFFRLRIAPVMPARP